MSQNILQVHMFGEFTLTYADKQIVCNNSRSKLIWNILAYLLCHRGKLVSTDDLISIIWKTEKNDNPAGAMRTAIHRARALLDTLTTDNSCQFLISKNGGYMWNPDIDVIVDIDVFESHLTALKTNPTINEIETCLAALDLYRGKFLPMASMEMWVIPIQTYYHNQFESILDRLIPQFQKEGRIHEGIELLRKALKLEPYSEKLYQHLMRFLLILDERQEIIQVYEEMSKLLLSVFNVLPDQESRSLYREALYSVKNGNTISPDIMQEELNEFEEPNGALICDYDFFKMFYQAQIRAIARNGIVIHTALITLKKRKTTTVSPKSLALAMDNLEQHMCSSLRKGDVITRCSSSQFIVMLSSANYENSCKVCRRFIASFEKKYPHTPISIDFFVQPLIPNTKS